MIKQTLEEWRAEATERFGKGVNWKFVCPSCGGVQSPKDFAERELDPQSSYQECIGRYVKEVDCNWAAYGFLGTLGKGRTIITPEGKEVEVFDFAAAPMNTD